MNLAKITEKPEGGVPPRRGVSWNVRLIILLLCLGFVLMALVLSLDLNKLLKYGFVGCFYLLLKLVQVRITGNETLGGPREPHSNRAKQV